MDTADAILAYGYDLGGDERGWKVEETDDHGHPAIAWHDIDGDKDNFVEEATGRLLAALAGFTETDQHADGYHDRRKAAEKSLDVHIVRHGDPNDTSYALATSSVSVEEGDSMPLNPAELFDPADLELRNRRLAAALAALGITPRQDRPQWLVLAYLS
ncbi:hypothetical protein CU254_41900 (plasmid) [Amycolatopsis sp. AA4]|uniref:hypothetical protein n=1 Tax=Actinomycetes TaxID=1760 RepID=UPI0001B56C2B|nr:MULTISPECIES: hypothetical protein [Actinomycetes]ATY17133.1 hypothetical protein CU254_41900 [Amycolatopsis sp. AA4]EFL12636.1 predicted protein [Streptomyces sp. AA4]